MARSKRTLLSALLSVGLIATLLAVTQAPASAQTTPSAVQQYLPEDTPWGGPGALATDPGVLSDKNDGTDTAAHLTAVASPDTDRVVWYVCPDTLTNPNSQTQLGTCEEIGRDSEPRTPTRSGAGAGIDEAYEFFWNITAAQEGQRDIIALACIGTGERVEGSNTNCITDWELDIDVDDGDTGGANTNTSAGEMTTYSTAGGTPPPASTFVPFFHGSTVPNDGFVFNATTSPELSTANGATVSWVIDATTTGSGAENDSEDFSAACAQTASSLSSTSWQCTVDGASVPDDGEMALALVESGTAGLGFCNGGGTRNCALDVHYLVSSSRGTTTATASFETPAAGSNPCLTPDKEENNTLDQEQDQPSDRTGGTPRGGGSGNEEMVRGCLGDRFGQAAGNQPVTFESSGTPTAGFSLCNAGTLHDHDGDGYYEHCHTTTAGGFAQAEIDNYGLTNTNTRGQAGTQTVVFCTDTQNNQGNADSTATQPVGHGCADEAAASQDTLSKGWIAVPTHVHLVFANTGDPANPCHSGDQFKENNIADIDLLLVCTRDGSDRASTTNQNGGGRLQWTIFPNAGGQTQTATRFDCSAAQGSCPPSETDANGEAQVSIEAINEGTDQIQVQLFNDLGTLLGTDFVQKRVRRSQETPTTTPPPTVDRHDRSLRITKMRHVRLNRKGRALLIKGEVSSPDFSSCATQVPIKVQIRKGGEWLTRKSDTTNDRGVFKVLIRDVTGRYRAIATKFIVRDPDANVTNVCRKAGDRKRHRHGRRR